MSKITEALRKAAREREERLRKQKETKAVPQSKGEETPSPPKKEKPALTSLREALRRRAEGQPVPATPAESPIAVPTQPSPITHGLDPHLITYFEPRSSASEQYRLIRTNLQSLDTQNPPRAIVISSSTYGEGKTITAINLAIVLAQDINKPILLIDYDLRKPQVCKYLGMNPQTGLADLLTNNIPLESALLSTEISNLTILSGNKAIPNPSSLLESTKMKHLLTEFKARFEYIIIDTPPVLPVTDAATIGSDADGVVLVIQADRTKKEIVQRAQSALAESQAKIIGFVLTGVQHPIPEFIYRHL